MGWGVFSSIILSRVVKESWRRPSSCPYCTGSDLNHCIRWGFYRRWAEGCDQQIRVQRYRCKVTARTFSLLPDALLPYHYPTTGRILGWLWALIVKRIGASTLATKLKVPRSTLRGVCKKFLRVVGALRLPGRSSSPGPVRYLRALARLTLSKLAGLLAANKQLEPKHSVVGLYAR